MPTWNSVKKICKTEACGFKYISFSLFLLGVMIRKQARHKKMEEVTTLHDIQIWP